MFPRAALMPPCAATVCERVGKSLVMHAVFRPASAQPMAARRPAPPAPTTTASYSWSTFFVVVGSVGGWQAVDGVVIRAGQFVRYGVTLHFAGAVQQ